MMTQILEAEHRGSEMRPAGIRCVVIKVSTDVVRAFGLVMSR
jgi:hypothetical protein